MAGPAAARGSDQLPGVPRTRLVDRAEHDVQPDVAVVAVVERAGDGADDLEAERLPEMYGGLVGLDDRVELDAAEACVLRPGQHVVAERPPDSATPRCRVDHEAGG